MGRKGLERLGKVCGLVGNIGFGLGSLLRISVEWPNIERFEGRRGTFEGIKGTEGGCLDLILAINAAKDWPGAACGTSNSLYQTLHHIFSSSYRSGVTCTLHIAFPPSFSIRLGSVLAVFSQ